MLIRKLFTGLASLAFCQLPIVLPVVSPQPAYAIPKKSAIAKLEAITVYALQKSEDQFIFSDTGNNKIVSLFFTSDRAQAALSSMKKSDPLLTAYVQKYSLDKLIPFIESTSSNASANTGNVVFALATDPVNTQQAYNILSAEGLSDSKIKNNLRVPVFFTEPMVNMNLPEQGKKQVFFLDYSTLQSVLAKVPNQSVRPKIKVLNLDQIIDVMQSNVRDVYAFYPSEDQD